MTSHYNLDCQAMAGVNGYGEGNAAAVCAWRPRKQEIIQVVDGILNFLLSHVPE